MRCVDVNVLVYAHRADSPEHEIHRRWLEEARSESELLGVADLVASGFVRVVTHPRIFRDPSPLASALDFVDALRTSPSVTVVAPGERHGEIFERLCREVGARGNGVPDAYFAAMALEHGATWVTADRGFRRFPGLRVEHPNG